MKNLLIKILQFKLKIIACAIIKKYNPRVIAVTGSFGKTSTKEAIFYALQPPLLALRKSDKSLNSQWGVPLTIIGAPDPHGSAFKWLTVLARGIRLVLATDKFYPNTLALEMGADRPGDISYLLTIAKPQVAVLTGVGHTHLENFGAIDRVAEEKLKLIKALPAGGVAVFNCDSPLIQQFITSARARFITYGLSNDAQVRATDIAHEMIDLPVEKTTATNPEHVGGVSFKIRYQDQNRQCYLPNVLGRTYVYPSLAAVAVAIGLGIEIDKAVEGLKGFAGVPGRMRLLRGVKGTFIIDDTYNASPEAMELALETLADVGGSGKKWAIFGEMLELGETTNELHARVGRRAADLAIDYLVTCGEPARHIAQGAIQAGFSSDRVLIFDDKQSAGRFVQNKMQPGDLLLVKGSRGLSRETSGTRMEKIVKELMAEPQRAEELLYITK